MAYTKSPNIATKDQLGLVIVGDNLDVTTDGVISVKLQGELAGPQGPTGPKGPRGPAGTSYKSELGVWVPKLISGPDGGSIDVDVINATYFKIDSFVFLMFDIEIKKVEDGNSYIMLEGIPFMSDDQKSYSGSLGINFFSGLSKGIISLKGNVRPKSYSCEIWKTKANVTSLEPLEHGDILVGSKLIGNISYITSEN